MIKLCVFDMDGTILDSLEDLQKAMNHALSTNNLPTIDSLEKIKEITGDGQVVFVKKAIGEPLNANDELVNKVLKDYVDYYDSHYAVYSKPYDGVLDLLHYLQDNKIKIAVITNKATHFAKTIADKLFNGISFEYIIGPSEEYPRKPDPKALLMILNELNVNKEECLYFGDTNTDMLTAKNAGVTAIGVTWGFRDRSELVENGAKHIITHPNQVIGLL